MPGNTCTVSLRIAADSYIYTWYDHVIQIQKYPLDNKLSFQSIFIVLFEITLREKKIAAKYQKTTKFDKHVHSVFPYENRRCKKFLKGYTFKNHIMCFMGRAPAVSGFKTGFI